MAAKEMGLVTVPCIVLGHLTRAQRKACVIADNKLALGFSPEEFAALTAGCRSSGRRHLV